MNKVIQNKILMYRNFLIRNFRSITIWGFLVPLKLSSDAEANGDPFASVFVQSSVGAVVARVPCISRVYCSLSTESVLVIKVTY